MNLKILGFNHHFEVEFDKLKKEKNWFAGRIAAEYKGLYKILAFSGEFTGEISGKMRYNNEFPAVGDWVVCSEVDYERVIIYHLLKRENKFSRTAAGSTGAEQIAAANIDIIFIVSSFNDDLNLRRLERYLTLSWDSGAKPVIILNKSDLKENTELMVNEVENIAAGADIISVSALKGTNIDKIKKYLGEGKTAAFLGSSGVGKSTIINKLLGREVQKVKEIRKDDSRGRHTTTNREMFLLESGGILIDTPGMREIKLWDGNTGFNSTFSDIEEIAAACRFNDCQHKSEPGCAVKKAIKQGKLDQKRLESYWKLKRELKYNEIKEKKSAGAAEKYKMKKLMQKN